MRRRRPRPPVIRYDIPDGAAFVSELEAVLQPRNWAAIALFCAANRCQLRDQREGDFITNMLAQTQAERPLSRKQMKWLRDIYNRLLKVAED